MWKKNIVSYSFDSNTPEYARSTIRASFDNWSKYAFRGSLTFVESAPSDIDVVWSLTDLVIDEQSFLAYTALVHKDGVMSHATVTVNGFALDPLNPFKPQKTLTGVSLHEIGHSVGLNHSTARAIMNPEFVGDSLQKDDIDAIGASYTVPPSDFGVFKAAMDRIGQMYSISVKFKIPKVLLNLPSNENGFIAVVVGTDTFFFDATTEFYLGLLSRNKFVVRK